LKDRILYIAFEVSKETNQKTGFSVMDNTLEGLKNMMQYIDFKKSYWIVTNQYHDEEYIMKERDKLERKK
jgi:hypothetical protein